MRDRSLVYDRHFVALLDVTAAAQGDKPDAPLPPPSRDSDALSSFSFPLVNLSEVRRFIASFERVSLVGFKFSGAMRSALEASFDPNVREAALSVCSTILCALAESRLSHTITLSTCGNQLHSCICVNMKS